MDYIYDPSLVLYLPLHERDGSSLASKDAYGHLCTVTGAVWKQKGRYFDGADDLLTVPYQASLNLTTALTVLAWINVDTFKATTQNGGTALIARYDTGVTKRVYNLALVNPDANGQPADCLGAFLGDPNDGSHEYSGCCDSAISADIWYHTALSFNVGTLKLHVNGNEKPLTGLVGAVPASLYSTDIALTMSARLNNGAGIEFSNVNIGEVRVYNRFLTPLEIQYNYLATKWRYR